MDSLQAVESEIACVTVVRLTRRSETEPWVRCQLKVTNKKA